MSPDNRQPLEEDWWRRVRDAKLQLDLARNYVHEVQSDQKAGLIPSADGNFAYQHALRAENLALRHYRDVLRTFADLGSRMETLASVARLKLSFAPSIGSLRRPAK